MNAIVFGRDKGGEVRRLLLPRKYACLAFLLALTLHLLWSVLFIFCVSAPEEMNAIVFEERRGRSQKSTACSKGISSEEEK